MKTIEKQNLLPFLLVGILFLLWGLANNMTDTLLAAFKHIMKMSDTQTSFIQSAFYGSYFCFALPAALFIRKYSFKAGVIIGLIMYASGAILFYPAAKIASYTFYLIAIYIMAGGCSILETTANPYIMSMGTPETATRRLNLAQALNPIGSILGILISQTFILQDISLYSVSSTYMYLGILLVIILIFMMFVRMPEGHTKDDDSPIESMRRLLKNKDYIWGVATQFFYVGAQIGVWSFTIRLVMHEMNVVEADAASIFLFSVIGFSVARFFFTWLMKYYRPTQLMLLSSALAILFTTVVVLGSGTKLLIISALIMVSFFMSLMFPTIYGTALADVEKDEKIGASGLIMAILGGAVITPLQGRVSDAWGINIAYTVPLFCFVVVLFYSIYVERKHKKISLT